jgi:Family of unknown function (DUF5706)
MALDNSWKQLQQVTEAVRYADTKAGLILTLNGVLIGLIAVRVQSQGFLGTHPLPAAFLLIAIAFLALSVAFDLAAVMPRLSAPGQRASLLHFDHVGERYPGRQDEYVDQLSVLLADPEDLRREIGAQVWANSLVARRKHTFIQRSLRLLGGAFAATVLATVIGALGG